MEEQLTRPYRFEGNGTGAITTLGERGEQMVVVRDLPDHPAAIQLCQALEMIAGDQRLAHAVKHEINRLYEPTAYQEEEAVLDAVRAGETLYRIGYTVRGPGDTRYPDQAKVLAASPQDAVTRVIQDVLEEEGDVLVTPIIESLDFQLLPRDSSRSEVILSPKCHGYYAVPESQSGIAIGQYGMERIDVSVIEI